MRIYLVGGAVRDRLLGIEPKERDWLVTGAGVEDMLEAGYRQVDADIPVFTHPHTGEEYALARREFKTEAGHKGFRFQIGADVTVEEDLRRRDLTVNAMAEADDGNIIDPWSGRDDLDRRRLRHVSPAFEEDPLRVLRLARFAAQLHEHGFVIEPDTVTVAARMSAGSDLATLSAGRVCKETLRALSSASPWRYFEALDEFGALHRLAPWLAPGTGTGRGVAIAVERAAAASEDPGARLAAACLAALKDGARGMPPDAWPLPRGVRDTVRTALTHPLPETFSAESTLGWMESVDAWRRADRFENLVVALKAASPHREGDAQRLASARSAALGLRPPPGSSDPRAALRALRLDAIDHSLTGATNP